MALTFRLVGECNMCGGCCTTASMGHVFVCEHLATTFAPIGIPLATSCRVYGERVDGMPITMHAASGLTLQGTCGKDSAREVAAIMQRGFGQGCSLTLEAVS
jgi:hypothetical protein